jgi:uncharacterized membrane protein YcaP (DUF421 family)
MAHYPVIDGNIDKELLKIIGMSEEELLSHLEKQQTPLEDVFLLGIDDGKNINIIKKEEK